MVQVSELRPIRIGTRASALAVSIAVTAAESMIDAGLTRGYEIVEIGEKSQGGDPSLFAGGSVMTRNLRAALANGDCDLAVHMVKDLPVGTHLTLGAVLPRREPHEALCSRRDWTIETLPEGAKVGISSPLRRTQLRRIRPDLAILPVRGPVLGRLQRIEAGELDATILDEAILVETGLESWISERIGIDDFLPTPGQGIVVLEKTDRLDDDAKAILKRISDKPTRLRLLTERRLESALRISSGIEAPIGAYSEILPGSGTRLLKLTALVCGPVRGTDLRRTRVVELPDGHAAIEAAINLGEELATDLVLAGASDLPSAEPKNIHVRPEVLLGRISPTVDAEFVRAIHAAGGEPLLVDLARTVPVADEDLDAVLDRLPKATRVGITSSLAVDLLGRRARDRGTSLADILERTPVAAFGALAGSALAAEMVTFDALPSVDVDIHALEEVWPQADPGQDAPLALLPISNNSSHTLGEALRELGWEVEEPLVYTRVTAELSPEHEAAIADGWPNAVILVTRSAAVGLEALFGMPPADVRIVAVGRIAAHDARELGLSVAAVSPSSRPPAVVRLALAGLVPQD